MIRSNYLSMEFWERLSKLSMKCGTAIFDCLRSDMEHEPWAN